jgi:hypothetical protein
MRWQPAEPICAECQFDWSRSRGSCRDLVVAAHHDALAALDNLADPTRRRGARWSASMYVWHLVDVLRIGSERLLTLRLDPARGIACWDENLLAEARRYALLSPVVGLAMLDVAARQWLDAAEQAPDADIAHPRYGTLSTVDVIRRNAHEVQHHLQDIRAS